MNTTYYAKDTVSDITSSVTSPVDESPSESSLRDSVEPQLFVAQLQRAIERCQREDGRLAMYIIGLDDLGMINGCFGSKAGDELMNIVDCRLKANVRSARGDVVSVISPGEFAVLCDGVGEDEEGIIFDRLATIFDDQFILSIGQVGIRGSIGCILCSPADEEENPRGLLRKARDSMLEYRHARNTQHTRKGGAEYPFCSHPQGLSRDRKSKALPKNTMEVFSACQTSCLSDLLT